MLTKKSFIVPASLGAIIMLLFFFVVNAASPVERFTNALFFTGLVEMLAGLGCVVRNGGIFKTLSYFQYRRGKKRVKDEIEHGVLPQNTHVMNFQEYIMEKYERKWDGIPFFISGAAFAALYAVFIIMIE